MSPRSKREYIEASIYGTNVPPVMKRITSWTNSVLSVGITENMRYDCLRVSNVLRNQKSGEGEESLSIKAMLY